MKCSECKYCERVENTKHVHYCNKYKTVVSPNSRICVKGEYKLKSNKK